MAEKDENVDKPEEAKTKKITVTYGDLISPMSPKQVALGRFCNLYIDIDINFQMDSLWQMIVDYQKKFETLKKSIYASVYGEEPKQVPDALPEDETPEQKNLREKNDSDYQREIAMLFHKEVELEIPVIQIRKVDLKKAMDREEKKINNGKDGVLIAPGDTSILKEFIDFV